MEWPLLSILVALPFAAAGLCAWLPNKYAAAAAWIAISCLLIELSLSVLIFTSLSTSAHTYEMGHFLWVERHLWFSIEATKHTIEIEYLLGVDGLSSPLLLLTTLIFSVGALSSWKISKQPRLFFSMYLLLLGGVVGALCSLDMLLFFLFFEFIVLPTYVLIAYWGGKKRETAALHFLIYTLAGSLLLLFVLLFLYASVEMPSTYRDGLVHKLDITEMIAQSHQLTDSVAWINTRIWGRPIQEWAFGALLIGFAIKLPVAPLHTWLPRAHVEASTGVSIVLAGVLLKIAGYGLIRIGFLAFIEQMTTYAPIIAIIAGGSIVYASLNALAQQDLKRMIAYSSVAHMGLVLIGIATYSDKGWAGAVYQMLSHGLIVAGLFFWVGALEDRYGSRFIPQLGGLAAQVPRLATFAAFFLFASFGMPGFSSFFAEFLILNGVVERIADGLLPWWLMMAPLLGILCAAAYSVWTMARVFQGKSINSFSSDLKASEWSVLALLAATVLLLGLYPQLILERIQPTLHHLISVVTTK